MSNHNDYLVMPDLMIIDHRRQDGSLSAPMMRGTFDLKGPMVLNALLSFYELTINSMVLTINGIPIGFTYPYP